MHNSIGIHTGGCKFVQIFDHREKTFSRGSPPVVRFTPVGPEFFSFGQPPVSEPVLAAGVDEHSSCEQVSANFVQRFENSRIRVHEHAVLDGFDVVFDFVENREVAVRASKS